MFEARTHRAYELRMLEQIPLEPNEVVLLSGGTSAAGPYIARELSKRGLRVCAVSRSLARLQDTYQNETCDPLLFEADLVDDTDVNALEVKLEKAGYTVAGIVHLVGGWSGGSGIQGQSETGYDKLAESFTALRLITRQFIAQLECSSLGRLIVVSSTVVSNPPPNSANYASVKAAMEAWTRSCDTQLSRHNKVGAATIIRTDSLSGREASFATLVGEILSAPAHRVSGRICTHI